MSRRTKIKWKSLTWLTVKYHKTNKLIQLYSSNDIFRALLLLNVFLKEELLGSAEKEGIWKLFLDDCHWSFLIYNVLPRNGEHPLLYCGWQKMLNWGCNFWNSGSLSEPFVTAGGRIVKQVKWSHCIWVIPEYSNQLISKNNLAFQVSIRCTGSVSLQLRLKSTA